MGGVSGSFTGCGKGWAEPRYSWASPPRITSQPSPAQPSSVQCSPGQVGQLWWQFYLAVAGALLGAEVFQTHHALLRDACDERTVARVDAPKREAASTLCSG